MANNGSRYHAEVKVELEGREARINVFADTLTEIFQDIGTICSQFPQWWKSPARAELVNAERKAAQPAAPQARVAGTPQVPVCAHCGSSEYMELIEFPSKKTGELKQAWKCQQCNEWHWPNVKKK